MIAHIEAQDKHPNQPSAGDIQAQIDLRVLVRCHLGPPLVSTPSADTHFNPFDPDGDALHVFRSHYRDPANQHNRGGAIKFIQKIRRCSYGEAIAYLEGWQHGLMSPTSPELHTEEGPR